MPGRPGTRTAVHATMVAIVAVNHLAWGQQPQATTPAPDSPPTAATPPVPASAAAEPATSAAATAANADDATQARAAFQKKFDAYKAAVRDIEKLQSEFQTADAATRERLNATLTGQVAHAQSLINEMVDEAVALHRLVPNVDPKITEFLTGVAKYYVVGRELPNSGGRIDGGDQYERALPIIDALVAGGTADREFLLFAFLAAFASNDYDLADRYLRQAYQAEPEDKPSPPKDAALDQAMGLIAKFAPALQQYRELWAKESAIRATEAAADDLPRVKLTTTKGEITLELFENEAPQAVANFLTLVKQGFYDGSPFHRVLPKFMAQGGAKGEQGDGGPGYTIRCECHRSNYRRHFRGTLSMAHRGRDTGSSQFFLTVVPTPHLDGEHTAFGRIIEGIEVLADLKRREPTGNPQADAALPKPDRILKAVVLRDRGHAYTFEKLPDP